MSITSVTPNIPPPNVDNLPVQVTDPAQPPLVAVAPAPDASGLPASTRTAQGPQQTPAPPAPTSRLGAILGAVARTVDTGLAGIPAGGRPSFMGGLGQGARAEQAAQANQQAIKFKSFDDQVRAANLHNQDLQMQQQNEDQQAARQAAVDFQTEAIGKQGGKVDTHPNDGTSAMQTLQAQTAANGSATIAPGTHISPNGKDINVPASNPPTMAAQLNNYKSMVGIMPGLPGAPSIPDPSSVKSMQDVTNARATMGKAFDIFTHLTNGHNVDGSVYTHQQLNDLIPAYQAQIDSHTAKGDLSDYQMGTLKNTLSILQADEQNHSDTEQAASDQATTNAANKKSKLDAIATQNKIEQQNNAAGNKAAEEQAKGNDKLVVAYDSGYVNADGTKGGNVVMTKGEAATKGLQHYPADGAKLNATVAGMNDVQNKLNQLADIATDKDKMAAVQPGVAAAMLAHGKGLEVGAFGTHMDTSRVNESLYAEDVKSANQATKDFVTATVAAHEAVTQLPRLQTFGQSSRMTQQQMEAAQNLLPHAGDGADFAAQKMTSLQGMLDPLRKQMPHMQGAETMPSWLEKRGGAQKQAPSQVAPTPVGSYNPSTRSVDYANMP